MHLLKKTLLLSFILCCHLLSVLTPANASIQALAAKNSDLAPICSGNGKIRWLSLSVYYQTGKMTFVELPSSPDNKPPNTCPTCSLFTTLEQHNATGFIHYITIVPVIALTIPEEFTPFTFLHLIPANSRAPPY